MSLDPGPTLPSCTPARSQDPPKKKSFKDTHVPSAPASMQLEVPWTEPKPFEGLRQKPDPTTFTERGKDFNHFIPKDKHGDIHKLSPQTVNKSWTASTHDPYYNEG